MRKASIPLLLLLAMMILPLLPVKADFPENFDRYAPGLANPNQWHFVTNNTNCFAGATYNLGHPASPPNDYLFSTHANSAGQCAVTNDGHLYTWFNATTTNVQITSYIRMTSSSSNPGPSQIKFYITATSYNKTANFAGNGFSNFTDANTVAFSYLKFTASIPTVPGSNVSIGFGFQFYPGATLPFGSPLGYEMDNVSIIGANLIIPNATVNLLDTFSRLQFNIAAYPNSNFQINYLTAQTCQAGWAQTASNQCTLNNLVTSYIVVPLTGATLFTVHVDNSYARTLIPTSTVHVNMLIDNASRVIPYTMTVTDLGQIFGSGSTIKIFNTNATITSGTLDQAASFSAPLVPGSYVVLLISGGRQFMTNLSLGTLVTQIQIQITKFVTGSNSGPTATISFSVFWGCSPNSLTTEYSDTSNHTTHLLILIYNQTSSGQFLIYNQSIAGPLGSIQNNFAGIFSSEGTYLVFFQPTISTGRATIGPVQFTPNNPGCPSSFPSILPNVGPQIPASLFGMSQFISNPNVWNWIIGLTFMIMAAGIFGARHASIGYIVTSMALLFFFLGFGFPLSYTIVYAFVITSITSFLVYRRRRPY